MTFMLNQEHRGSNCISSRSRSQITQCVVFEPYVYFITNYIASLTFNATMHDLRNGRLYAVHKKEREGDLNRIHSPVSSLSSQVAVTLFLLCFLTNKRKKRKKHTCTHFDVSAKQTQLNKSREL